MAGAMEPDFMLDFDVSSLSMSNDLDALFFSPEANTLQRLLEAEAMLLQEEAHNDSTVAGTPLRSSRETNPQRVRMLQPSREQCYSVLLGGAPLSRPAVHGAAVAFGTEATDGAGNRLVVVDSIARPAGDSRIVPVSGPVTAMTFVGSAQHVCFGRVQGGLGILSADEPEPTYFSPWHTDDVRDLALLSGTHQHQIASCSYDGTVCVADILQGAPLLRMELRTSVSSLAAHPRHPQVLSCTADAGALLVRDLRVGRVRGVRHSDLPLSAGSFGETGGLLDHAWLGDFQCILAHANGTLATVDTRSSRVLSQTRCDETNLDSVEYHAATSTLAVFGSGCTLLALDDDALPVETARYRPRFERATRNAGAFGGGDSDVSLYITAPDSSMVFVKVPSE
jgi:WD40 repeat protein